jgi:hypothetical protein
MVQDQPGQIVHKTPISKITRAKMDWKCRPMVEHLLCKYKALISNASPTKKKKKEFYI